MPETSPVFPNDVQRWRCLLCGKEDNLASWPDCQGTKFDGSPCEEEYSKDKASPPTFSEDDNSETSSEAMKYMPVPTGQQYSVDYNPEAEHTTIERETGTGTIQTENESGTVDEQSESVDEIEEPVYERLQRILENREHRESGGSSPNLGEISGDEV
jgi:hypothetical protein